MQVATVQDVCHTITFPFNNRRLIEIVLSILREKRIDDTMHKDIMKLANNKIADWQIHIKNNYFKTNRIWLEKIYY